MSQVAKLHDHGSEPKHAAHPAKRAPMDRRIVPAILAILLAAILLYLMPRIGGNSAGRDSSSPQEMQAEQAHSEAIANNPHIPPRLRESAAAAARAMQSNAEKQGQSAPRPH